MVPVRMAKEEIYGEVLHTTGHEIEPSAGFRFQHQDKHGLVCSYSTQEVLPPKMRLEWSGVGIEPLTPQNLTCIMG